jgi:UDP-N-acetylmuramoyl-L-alanyl-D-glutamate--2,6-diaminopimelate ligase
VGLIGTVNYLIGDRVLPAPHTTPEAPEFQGLLRQMCSDGCSFVATEVSSHALAQRRVDATQFAVAVFTNLTRDHLDYHGTFDAYYAAKQRLFTELLNVTGTAVVNVDDVWGRRLLSEIDRPVLTYGLESDADLTACNVTHRFSGMRFSLHRKGGEPVMIESGLIGLVNVSNILAAVGACISVGVPMDCIHEGIRKALPVPGRLQKIDEGQDFLCIVDYAHTPDALERLLTEAGRLAAVTGGRIITVFGCGGNRDRGKRPVMGEISARLSDVVFVTSDNPREEDPSAIIAGIESGLRGKALCSSLPDRAEAIDRAIGVARSGDVVVIAGKGHEDYQEIGDRRLRFDDRVKAAEAIRLKMKQERGSP